ncbi:MAG: signal peptidase II [Deltaproteobacteria bacterium]|nr:MAG: signal peptidase II [Deltaproteobacteria bacterium]
MQLKKPWWQRWTLFACLASVITIADQTSKIWAVGALTDAYSAFPGSKLQSFWHTAHPRAARVATVSQNFWHFRYIENPGAAWSFLSNSPSAWRTPFFLIVSICAMATIVAYFRRTEPTQWLLRSCLASIMGGAVGNFIDRARLGYVIDFIDWHYYNSFTWPTFNVADAAITVGVLVALLEMFLYGGQGESSQANQRTTP